MLFSHRLQCDPLPRKRIALAKLLSQIRLQRPHRSPIDRCGGKPGEQAAALRCRPSRPGSTRCRVAISRTCFRAGAALRARKTPPGNRVEPIIGDAGLARRFLGPFFAPTDPYGPRGAYGRLPHLATETSPTGFCVRGTAARRPLRCGGSILPVSWNDLNAPGRKAGSAPPTPWNWRSLVWAAENIRCSAVN